MLQVLLKRNSSNKEAGLKEAGLAKAFVAALDSLQAAISAANPAASRQDEPEAVGGLLPLAVESLQSYQVRFPPGNTTLLQRALSCLSLLPLSPWDASDGILLSNRCRQLPPQDVEP